ncbi:MAG: hypothetical protein SGI77_11740 [Pirellulaceae bacterium]|nr:hypothetical protein [Pirellulaceae bacterium]
MNTRLLLVLVVFLALLSTISSSVALFLVVQNLGGDHQLIERVNAIESRLLESNRPQRSQDSQAAQLSVTLNAIFQRLSEHEQSLNESARQIADSLSSGVSKQ